MQTKLYETLVDKHREEILAAECGQSPRSRTLIPSMPS